MHPSKKPIVYNNAAQLEIRNRGRLPHWNLAGGIYFVTYHLADALPEHVLRSLIAEREALVRALTGGQREPTASEASELSVLMLIRTDGYLDRGNGACLLKDSRSARVVVENWKYFDRKRYDLIAWTVMPNHVHIVFRLGFSCDLDEVIHSWKSYTSNRINAIHGRAGTLWQREYFDRLVRDERELREAIDYVSSNASRAGLGNWPWVGSRLFQI